MKKKIVSTLGISFLGLIVVASIAVGAGGAIPPSGPPPPSVSVPTLPCGFFPYKGYHYSGYVVAINPTDRTFSYYLGRIQDYGRDPWLDEKQTVLVETDDSTIFYRINHQGKEERCNFQNLKLNQLVWLEGVETKPGWVVLKIQLSDWIKQK